MKTLDDVAREIAGLLERLGVEYAIMGGLAMRLHAIPRPTYDVDFTVALARDRVAELYREIERLGYEIPAAQATGWIDAVQGLPVLKFQTIEDASSIDVDMFLAETAYQRELIARRCRYTAEGWSAWFVSPEDLILLKLIADRPKDRVDVADVLFVQGRVDENYLRLWAERLKIADRLTTALESSQE